jgi:hypothetical protein
VDSPPKPTPIRIGSRVSGVERRKSLQTITTRTPKMSPPTGNGADKPKLHRPAADDRPFSKPPTPCTSGPPRCPASNADSPTTTTSTNATKPGSTLNPQKPYRLRIVGWPERWPSADARTGPAPPALPARPGPPRLHGQGRPQAVAQRSQQRPLKPEEPAPVPCAARSHNDH